MTTNAVLKPDLRDLIRAFEAGRRRALENLARDVTSPDMDIEQVQLVAMYQTAIQAARETIETMKE